MHKQARSEQEIVKALGEALKRADDQLLVAIRNIAHEHEMRREGILRELQALATRLGGFPISRVLARPLQDAPVDLPNDETNQPQGPCRASSLPGNHAGRAQLGSHLVFRRAQTGALTEQL